MTFWIKNAVLLCISVLYLKVKRDDEETRRNDDIVFRPKIKIFRVRFIYIRGFPRVRLIGYGHVMIVRVNVFRARDT